MIPDPLHPAVVHIPVAIAVILPLLIILSLVLIRRGASQGIAWLPITVLSLFLFSGALLAQRTGEDEEEAVEEFVPERYIEEHEEQAELFTIVAGILFGLSIMGLFGKQFGKQFGKYARLGAGGVSVILLVFAFQTGHSGGELVYKHGAANAASAEAAPGRTSMQSVDSDDDEDHDDDSDHDDASDDHD